MPKQKKFRLDAECWVLAYRERPRGSILEDKETPFIILKNSSRYWAADPFLIERGGKTYLFAELYDYVRRRGVIGYRLLGEKSKWMPVLIESTHLSYPCLIEYKGEIYLLPESSKSGRLVLYRATDFPDEWAAAAILREGVRYADTTPLPERDSALSYDVTCPGCYALRLLEGKSALQDTALPFSDPERRRPAGQIFCCGGKTIRPAQNCTGSYGEGLIFYEREDAPPGDYRERELLCLSPDDLRFTKEIPMIGMHTYNATDRYEVIDLKSRHFNLLNFCMRIVGKLTDALAKPDAAATAGGGGEMRP